MLIPILAIAARDGKVTHNSLQRPIRQLFPECLAGLKRPGTDKTATLFKMIAKANSYLLGSGHLTTSGNGVYSLTPQGRRSLHQLLERSGLKLPKELDLQIGHSAERGDDPDEDPVPGTAPFSHPAPAEARNRSAAAGKAVPPSRETLPQAGTRRTLASPDTVRPTPARIREEGTGTTSGNAPADGQAPRAPKPEDAGGASSVEISEILLPALMAADALAGRSSAGPEELAGPVLEIVAARREARGLPPPEPDRVFFLFMLNSAVHDLATAGLLEKFDPRSPGWRLTGEGKRVLSGAPVDLNYIRLTAFPSGGGSATGIEGEDSFGRAETIAGTRAAEALGLRVNRLGRNGFRNLARELARAAALRKGEREPGGPADGYGGDAELPFVDIAASDGPSALDGLKNFALAMEAGGDGRWALFARGSFPRKAEKLLSALSPELKATDLAATAELMLKLGVGTKVRKVLELRQISPGFFRNLLRYPEAAPEGPDGADPDPEPDPNPDGAVPDAG
jgi:hypothetical protein